MQQTIALRLVKEHSSLETWARFKFIASCKDRFNVFRCTLYNDQCEHFFPQKWTDSPQIVEISPLGVEISPLCPLFRNYTNSIIVKLDLMYTHAIENHQISSIS